MKKKVVILLLLFSAIFYWNYLPEKLFNSPVCVVINDRNGELLSAHIASDGQYRFPSIKNVPIKFEKAITTFEDKRFRSHWGFDILAFSRAVKQNISQKRIVSGGSTITMQVIRLSRQRDRTIWEKIKEILLATRMELSYSKNEILSLYASNAPFGGNVVGLNTASWRYFGVKPEKLTWAESAMLAVLPNSPSLIHLGKNRKLLFEKRNRLLKKMFKNNIFDKETYELAIDEPIPSKPHPFPRLAPHLLSRILTSKNPELKETSLIADIQVKTNKILARHNAKLQENDINNLAAIIIEVETGKVIAYIGNVNNFSSKNSGNQVDIITANRSTGSILKPFLYASMLTDGEILPRSLIFDIPTRIGGYTPKNYSRGYDGAVPANEALARSLNIPAVRMLRQYGMEKLYSKLEKLGMTSLTNAPSYYGLSLILGGCEASLWELTGMYASMARTLNHYDKFGQRYSKKDYHPPTYKKISPYKTNKNKQIWKTLEKNSILNASSIYFTFEAMLDVERPDDNSQWESFESSEKIAWKTGTSFGFRDAWAIGITPKYVVGVWAGNADGEGRPDIIGIRAAAPVLFDIFDILPDAEKWFKQPKSDMIKVNVCQKSGFLASQNCDIIEEELVPVLGERSKVCPYHKLIHLDKTEKYQVNSNCESVENMITKSWFILPPSVENYYKRKHSTYKYLPPFKEGCGNNLQDFNRNMELVYPFHNSKIFVPLELDGTFGKTVFEAAHRKKGSTIFWYVDDELIGKTSEIHTIELHPKAGKHTLTLIDESGEELKTYFTVIGRK